MDIQNIITILAVLGACLYLALRFFKQKKSDNCDKCSKN